MEKNMKNIAIITARGGSKRIPRKNIKEFLGKPILAYSIEAALASGSFDEVMVSTDDKEIADVAVKHGANVPFFRSPETSNDFATSADVINEVLDKYASMGKQYDNFVCIYPTAPFITGEKLSKAIEMLCEAKADTVMPVVPFSFPPQRGLIIKDGSLAFREPQYALTRSQDLEPMYHDCGQFYVCSCASFEKHHALVMPHTVPFIMPEEEVQDIDNFSDWNLAELKYKMFLENK